jgi:hypothetical protein
MTDRRGVFVSLSAALARGYRPLGPATADQELRSMVVRLVDRSGDIARATMTSDEWRTHILHAALARGHAHELGPGGQMHVLVRHARAGGRRWAEARDTPRKRRRAYGQ